MQPNVPKVNNGGKPLWKKNRLYVGPVLALTVCAVVAFNYESEPRYQGKTISHWFKAWLKEPNAWSRPPEAFREIGSNAVPHLVRALQKQRSPLGSAYEYVYKILPDELQRRLPRPQLAGVIRWKAARALRELGPEARSALPALTDALHDPESRVRYAALAVISGVGLESRVVLPELIQALENPDRWSRFYLTLAIVNIGGYSEEIIPSLAGALIDMIRASESPTLEALQTFRKLNPLTPEAVGALMDAVRDQDRFLKRTKTDRSTPTALRAATVKALTELARTNNLARTVISQRCGATDPAIRTIASEIAQLLEAP